MHAFNFLSKLFVLLVAYFSLPPISHLDIFFYLIDIDLDEDQMKGTSMIIQKIYIYLEI